MAAMADRKAEEDNAGEAQEGNEGDWPVVVNDLTFAYPGQAPTLQNINLRLPRGSRCLLIGANGSGKSTLLRILAGKHLYKPDESVSVLSRNAFRDTSLNADRAFLDLNWGTQTVAFAGYGVPLSADIAVSEMMPTLQAAYPERRAALLEVLGIDPAWRLHKLSDGQRRRVAVLLACIRPFEILLMDEVTVSLDVLVRMDILRWLRQDSEQRGATIIYVSHIFDGLLDDVDGKDWPTHLHFLTHEGRTGWQGELKNLEEYSRLRDEGHPSPLLRIAETWLREEVEELKARNLRHLEREQGQRAYEEFAGASAGGYADGRGLTGKNDP